MYSTNSYASTISGFMHVLGYELVRPYGVCAVMLLGHVVVIAAKFLPLDDGERGVQRVQFGNLDVLGILVGRFAVGERRAAPKVIALIRCAGRNRDDSSERVVLPELYSHAYVDEGYAPFLQPFNDQPLAGALVDAD